MESRKQRVAQRLDKFNFPENFCQPMMRGPAPRFELASRAVGTAYAGIALVHRLAKQLGLDQEINSRLRLFRLPLPYHESDHVLSLAYNTLCGGCCLEDLELRRQDEAYLNLLGAERIPDPTTAADFCRRFQPQHVQALHEVFDAVRLKVWARQPKEFFDCAYIDADGTMVKTDAERMQGIDMNHKGEWGYHPLVVTLANTGEVLRLKNRSGNRPSHEGAADQTNQAMEVCRRGGFRRMFLRGDTDFSQTKYLDGWHEQKDVTFLFGYDRNPSVVAIAEDLPETAWKKLSRPPKYTVQTQTRSKPANVREALVKEKGLKNIRMLGEWTAEFDYQPAACRRAYRMVVLRKELEISEPRQGTLFEQYRYFFFITNDTQLSTRDVVLTANDRCDQENLLAQLKGCRTLHAPVNNLTANEAYMVMTSLAWNLKAWMGLWLPEGKGVKQKDYPAQKRKVLRMEFRTFVNRWLRIPGQVVRTGRQLVVRLLAWNDALPVFFRLAAELHC